MASSRPTHLPPALDAEVLRLESSAGALALYAAGPPRSEAPPLLLVHSINAAASAFEVRPLFEAYRVRRPVYALDLPGYGLSARDAGPYLPRRMTDAVLAAAALVRRRHGGAAPDALALSLSCEYLARAAVEEPAAFRTVALVSPTGIERARPRRGAPGSTRGVPWLLRFFLARGIGRGLFRQLTRPGVIRYFLRRTWGSRAIDEPLLAYDVLTAAQPGAEHAPLYFLSAFLFSGDAAALYDSLPQPAWVVHGVRGDFTRFRYAQVLAQRPGWKLDVLPTGALPHFELLDEFVRRYDAFLAAHSPPALR